MRMHPDVARTGGALLVLAALALVVTNVDAGSERARARAMSATGAAVVSNGLAGDAVLRAADMEPGERVTGTVTVGNSGDATGSFRLAQSDVLDVPGSGGGRLSTMLRLTVEDTRTGRRIYRGVLGAMDEQALGYLRAGEEGTYRFTLAYPGRAANGSYAGSRVETTFDWTAATREPPATDPRRDTTTPTLVVQSPRSQRFDGRTVTVALTCGDRCVVVGASRGAPSAPGMPLSPGRPALRTVHLSRADARALETRLEQRGTATLPLRLTVADPAGKRATAGVPIRLVR